MNTFQLKMNSKPLMAQLLLLEKIAESGVELIDTSLDFGLTLNELGRVERDLDSTGTGEAVISLYPSNRLLDFISTFTFDINNVTVKQASHTNPH